MNSLQFYELNYFIYLYFIFIFLGANAETRLIVTDGVFSMDGDIAPLDKIVSLAKKYKAMIMVDESHAAGFMGPTGRGVPEMFGVQKDIDIVTGKYKYIK
jgi:glycine C-acetyltransferase